VRWHQEGAWDFSGGSDQGVFVQLTWSLERTMANRAEGAREDLRADMERERWRLRENLSVLLAALREHCRRGDQQALLEVHAQIDMLTAGAAW
jgi:hypothetical protein